jgi:type IV secretion system protein VirB1
MMDIFTLILACTPLMPPDTVAAVIHAESEGNPLAINVNAEDLSLPEPENAQAAAAMASELIEQGFNLDLGLMQINSDNFSPLNLTVEQVFDPCTNIRAGTTILQNNYQNALAEGFAPGRAAFEAALSAYNTGKFRGKVGQRYVERIYKTAGLSPTAQVNNPYTAPTKVYSKKQEKKESGKNQQKSLAFNNKSPFETSQSRSSSKTQPPQQSIADNPFTAPTKVWQRTPKTPPQDPVTPSSPSSESSSSSSAKKSRL